MISEKFKNIPVEEDTKILTRKEIKILDYDAIHEIWAWEGIHAESLVFFNEDINDLNEDEIWLLVDNYIDKDKATYKKTNEYIFVNFNYTTPY